MSSSFPATRFPLVHPGRERDVAEDAPETGLATSGEACDRSLIARICANDSDALGLLFSRYARLVWTIGRRILRNNEEADDLLQDVFLLVRRRAAAFDPSKGTVRSLLVQMCYQRAFSRRRDLSRRCFYSDTDVTGDSVVAGRSSLLPYDEGLEAHFGRATLKRALEDLSTEQRETIRLCFFEGYTLEEIAVRLGLTYGNVRNHYYRGLARLRRHVASE